MLSASTRSSQKPTTWRAMSRLTIVALALMGVLIGVVSTHVVIDRATHSMAAMTEERAAMTEPMPVAAASAQDEVMTASVLSCGQVCELACVAIGLAAVFMLAVLFVLRGPSMSFATAAFTRTLQAIDRATRGNITRRAPSLTALSISRT